MRRCTRCTTSHKTGLFSTSKERAWLAECTWMSRTSQNFIMIKYQYAMDWIKAGRKSCSRITFTLGLPWLPCLSLKPRSQIHLFSSAWLPKLPRAACLAMRYWFWLKSTPPSLFYTSTTYLAELIWQLSLEEGDDGDYIPTDVDSEDGLAGWRRMPFLKEPWVWTSTVPHSEYVASYALLSLFPTSSELTGLAPRTSRWLKDGSTICVSETNEQVENWEFCLFSNTPVKFDVILLSGYDNMPQFS